MLPGKLSGHYWYNALIAAYYCWDLFVFNQLYTLHWIIPVYIKVNYIYSIKIGFAALFVMGILYLQEQRESSETIIKMPDGTFTVKSQLLLFPGLIGRLPNATDPVTIDDERKNFTCQVSHSEFPNEEERYFHVAIHLLCKLEWTKMYPATYTSHL